MLCKQHTLHAMSRHHTRHIFRCDHTRGERLNRPVPQISPVHILLEQCSMGVESLGPTRAPPAGLTGLAARGAAGRPHGTSAGTRRRTPAARHRRSTPRRRMSSSPSVAALGVSPRLPEPMGVPKGHSGCCAAHGRCLHEPRGAQTSSLRDVACFRVSQPHARRRLLLCEVSGLHRRHRTCLTCFASRMMMNAHTAHARSVAIVANRLPVVPAYLARPRAVHGQRHAADLDRGCQRRARAAGPAAAPRHVRPHCLRRGRRRGRGRSLRAAHAAAAARHVRPRGGPCAIRAAGAAPAARRVCPRGRWIAVAQECHGSSSVEHSRVAGDAVTRPHGLRAVHAHR